MPSLAIPGLLPGMKSCVTGMTVCAMRRNWDNTTATSLLSRRWRINDITRFLFHLFIWDFLQHSRLKMMFSISFFVFGKHCPSSSCTSRLLLKLYFPILFLCYVVFECRQTVFTSIRYDNSINQMSICSNLHLLLLFSLMSFLVFHE